VQLLLAAMMVSIVLGMVLRKHEQVWRVLLMVLSIGVTTLYFVFAETFMK
jgi:hypothetical protein